MQSNRILGGSYDLGSAQLAPRFYIARVLQSTVLLQCFKMID